MVERTERGWAGHFICANACRFRRNTLLKKGKTKIVVSTVGLMESPIGENEFTIVGVDRYYETMAFFAKSNDKFCDADVGREIEFESSWYLSELDAEIEANEMHEQVVYELTQKLEKGIIKEIRR